MTDKEIIDLVVEKVTEAYHRGVMDGVKIAGSYQKAITTPIDFTPDIPQSPLTVSVYAAPAYPRFNEVITKMEVSNETSD
ncbi:MAG: hypothetical protein J5617_03790 [Bacilli bacterium]|nr:hypothetical protein [Bacilli bacterium]